MLTVKRLREVLAKFPDDARCHAYEGEGTGIAISLAGEAGFIDCRDTDDEDTEIDFFRSGEVGHQSRSEFSEAAAREILEGITGHPVEGVRSITISAPDEWQPIETAPRDETPIIVGFDCASVWIVHKAWWRDGAALQAIGLDFTAADTGWWSYVRGSVTQEHLDGWRTPTHWIPMPDLPS